jgi:hypothetical protein
VVQGSGHFRLTFTPDNGVTKTYDVFKFVDGGVALGMYNTDEVCEHCNMMMTISHLIEYSRLCPFMLSICNQQEMAALFEHKEYDSEEIRWSL